VQRLLKTGHISVWCYVHLDNKLARTFVTRRLRKKLLRDFLTPASKYSALHVIFWRYIIAGEKSHWMSRGVGMWNLIQIMTESGLEREIPCALTPIWGHREDLLSFSKMVLCVTETIQDYGGFLLTKFPYFLPSQFSPLNWYSLSSN
jgi:hypothetical protein